MKRRICIFSLAYFPHIGGAEIAIKEITDRLNSFHFDLITARFNSKLPRYEKIGNVSLYRVGFGVPNPSADDLASFRLYLTKILFPILAWIKAERLHNKQSYDLLWSVISYAGFPAVFFKWRHPTVPYLLTLQDGDTIKHIKNRIRIKAVYPLFRKIFTMADAVQAISHFLALFARNMGAHAITVIPNGVDVASFSERSNSLLIEAKLNRVKDEGKIELNESDTVIFSASRLVPKNGLFDLVSALSFLPEEVKLIIIGDGPLRSKLFEKIKKLGLLGRVAILAEPVYREVAIYYHMGPFAGKIFIRPSLSEGLGSAFLEAMAAGIPVIGTPVGGIPDFLKDGETGWLVSPSAPKEIAVRVREIMARNNSEKVAHIVLHAKKVVQDSYTWEQIASKMQDLFLTTIDGKRK